MTGNTASYYNAHCCSVHILSESPKDCLRILINTALCKMEVFPEFNPGMHTQDNSRYAVLTGMNVKVALSQPISTKNSVVLLQFCICFEFI